MPLPSVTALTPAKGNPGALSYNAAYRLPPSSWVVPSIPSS
jgi:hypothetical protein